MAQTGVKHTIAGSSGASIQLDGDQQWSVDGALEITAVIWDDGDARPSLVKTGPGTLTLSGNNWFSGRSSINQGAISVSTIAAKGPACNLGRGDLTLDGGTLRFTGTDPNVATSRGFALARPAARSTCKTSARRSPFPARCPAARWTDEDRQRHLDSDGGQRLQRLDHRRAGNAGVGPAAFDAVLNTAGRRPEPTSRAANWCSTMRASPIPSGRSGLAETDYDGRWDTGKFDRRSGRIDLGL